MLPDTFPPPSTSAETVMAAAYPQEAGATPQSEAAALDDQDEMAAATCLQQVRSDPASSFMLSPTSSYHSMAMATTADGVYGMPPAQPPMMLISPTVLDEIVTQMADLGDSVRQMRQQLKVVHAAQGTTTKQLRLLADHAVKQEDSLKAHKSMLSQLIAHQTQITNIFRGMAAKDAAAKETAARAAMQQQRAALPLSKPVASLAAMPKSLAPLPARAAVAVTPLASAAPSSSMPSVGVKVVPTAVVPDVPTLLPAPAQQGTQEHDDAAFAAAVAAADDDHSSGDDSDDGQGQQEGVEDDDYVIGQKPSAGEAYIDGNKVRVPHKKKGRRPRKNFSSELISGLLAAVREELMRGTHANVRSAVSAAAAKVSTQGECPFDRKSIMRKWYHMAGEGASAPKARGEEAAAHLAAIQSMLQEYPVREADPPRGRRPSSQAPIRNVGNLHSYDPTSSAPHHEVPPPVPTTPGTAGMVTQEDETAAKAKAKATLQKSLMSRLSAAKSTLTSKYTSKESAHHHKHKGVAAEVEGAPQEEAASVTTGITGPSPAPATKADETMLPAAPADEAIGAPLPAVAPTSATFAASWPKARSTTISTTPAKSGAKRSRKERVEADQQDEKGLRSTDSSSSLSSSSPAKPKLHRRELDSLMKTMGWEH